ncbi:Asp-tRNA(Asn)/Glu-tRNA(Gln) amidotransferase subunit GatC [Candidatus Woesearchaeota archaeon]|nr:Asp-tRNA(Asn)/Glu-tRNA(Gln) amidotransferase subunit GatC [Candidatus Woesearchaeota archaeon]
MNIDTSLIENVASLARLELKDPEKKKFVEDFKEILKAFSELDNADVKDVKMSVQPIEMQDSMREDLKEESLSQKEALKNAKHKKDGYFKGPRAV